MDIKTLTIYVDDNETAAANVNPEDAPKLFEAFRMWQAADERSARERAAWDRVLELAAEYLSDTGDFLDADGMEVSDVTCF